MANRAALTALLTLMACSDGTDRLDRVLDQDAGFTADSSMVQPDAYQAPDAGFLDASQQDAQAPSCGEPRPTGNCSVKLVWTLNPQERWSKMFYDNTFPCLRESYGDRLIITHGFLDLPFLPNGRRAAEAYECANRQDNNGENFDYLGRLLANQQALDEASLKIYARGVVMDPALFDTCLDTRLTASRVEMQDQLSLEHGIQGVPTFDIYGIGTPQIRIEGAQTYDEYARALNSLCD